MGQVQSFACSACGYSGEATVGGTMAGFRTNDPFPAICRCSKEVVSVNMAKQPHKCAECGGSNFKLYGDETRSASSEAEVLTERRRHEPESFRAEGAAEHRKLFWDEGAHICPACGKHGLRFSSPSLMFD
jgi:predicted RNA-binding Zn-ribbon protein involved in translation (DUF1610 family)